MSHGDYGLNPNKGDEVWERTSI